MPVYRPVEIRSHVQASPVGQLPCLPVLVAQSAAAMQFFAQSAAAILAVAVAVGIQADAPVAVLMMAVLVGAGAIATHWLVGQCQQLQLTLQAIAASLAQVETTSQVVATRANAEEWRQCLQFSAAWHQCSVQAAYKLWQEGLLGVPAIPASQWYWKSSGQDMSPSDQNLADQDIPPVLVQLLRHQASLSAAHEKLQRHQLGQFKYTAQEQERLARYEQLYQQLKQVHGQTQFQFQAHGQTMTNLAQVLTQSLPDQDELLQ